MTPEQIKQSDEMLVRLLDAVGPPGHAKLDLDVTCVAVGRLVGTVAAINHMPASSMSLMMYYAYRVLEE